MPERWVISDTHFGHANILTFFDDTGKKVREFQSVEEMDETMVNNWNRVVGHNDIVYHCGDVVMNKKFLPILNRLNGSKRLILGNHDPFFEEYPKYFKNIYAMRIFPRKCILTHIPIEKGSVDRFKVNIHGHIHTYYVKDTAWSTPDKRYVNVCVDYPGNNYTPHNLDVILS